MPDDINTIIRSWRDFVATIDDAVIKIMLGHEAQPAYLEDNILTIVCDYPNHFDTIKKKKDDIKFYQFV